MNDVALREGLSETLTAVETDQAYSKPASRPHSRSGAPQLEAPPSKTWLNNLRRPRTSPGPKPSPLIARSQLSDDIRRDSALLPASPATTAASTTPDSGTHDISRVSSLPVIVVHRSQLQDDGRDGDKEPEMQSVPRMNQPNSQTVPIPAFSGITTSIPTGGLDDISSPEKVQFSQRGSMLLDGKRAAVFADKPQASRTPRTPPEPSSQLRSEDSRRLNPSTRQTRALSADEMELSQKVRSMYDYGHERGADWSDRALTDQTLVEEEDELDTPTRMTESTLTVDRTRVHGQDLRRSPSFNSKRESFIQKEPFELAGGIEDWEDIQGGDVDRYGFILVRKPGSRGSNHSSAPYESPRPMRASTVLMDASETPRRKRTVRRSPSKASKARTSPGSTSNGMPSRRASKRSLRPPGSIYSYHSASSLSLTQSPLRYASNRLPHNKDRRWMEEASDMLTLPPGLADLAAMEDGGKAALAMKRKEWEREEKWRKMGKATQRSNKGGGMIFEFDTKDPKVISRTWKGIPDKWRASAWYSFLTTSAKRRDDLACEDELIASFYDLQTESSADDVQIDCDVPRTINSHIMFRRRYRGGQRLLFRVLHALSLHLPETGYVQGMATLAATLLCYYDEEQAFVMMVRLWQLRGMDRLYSSGFGGLMEALEEFEKEWLRGGDVAKKLEEFGITSTAYGTRWYLTLFNYSIPFQAQLRVWDVFMLLGDVSHASDPNNAFGADLDVLHATSAALVDATREILLDSDFENAMKVLTSWIPVKDEDLLMRVAHAEWKQRKRRS